MTNSTNVVIVHNTSTEFLIIISQTVFFVLLFLMLKNGLVDRRGMMYSKQRVKEEMLQLCAIFFAIFVIVGIIMIPLESYEYAHFVIPITYIIMVSLVGWELYVVFNREDGCDSPTLPTIKSVTHFEKSSLVKNGGSPSDSIGPAESGSSVFWSRGGTSSSSSGTSRRPFNF